MSEEWSKGSCVLPWVLSDLWSSLNLRAILDLAYLVGVCHGKSHLWVNKTNTSSFSFEVNFIRWNSRWKKVSIYSSDLISVVLKPFYTLLFTAQVGDRGEGLDMPWMTEEPMNQRWEGSFSTLHTTTDTHMPPTKDTHKALSTQPTDYSYTRYSRALLKVNSTNTVHVNIPTSTCCSLQLNVDQKHKSDETERFQIASVTCHVILQ